MKQRVTGRYFYKGVDGKTAYWKERIEPGRKSYKEFRFYHGNRESGRGGDPILYNLPLVIRSRSVIFTEGEKQADIVTKWGLCGTTFDSGANSKFPHDMVEHLRGKRVAVLRDNDGPGLAYAEMIGKALHGVAEFVRIVLLPGLPAKGDICDWILTKGNDKAAMLGEIQKASTYVYKPEHFKPKRDNQKPEERTVDGDMVSIAKSVPVENLIDFRAKYAFCLWHEDTIPSLHHHEASNRVKCFACGKGADAIDIVMKRDSVGFKDAVRVLCGG